MTKIFLTAAALVGALTVAPARAFGPVPTAAACRSLEALYAIAQKKLAEGYQPTARQVRDGQARYAWYVKHCQK